MPVDLLNIEDLRHIFEKDALTADPFQICKSLCVLQSQSSTIDFQDILLRALEHRHSFGDAQPILRGLVREVGLFPYLDPEKLAPEDRLAYEFHKPDNMHKGIVFHRPQARVYREILRGKNVILSAPTSFGKSLIIDAVVRSGRYKNILVIVPTIALIDETRRRLATVDPSYKVVTHKSQSSADKNIFVLTQERVFEDFDLDLVDFFVIDEFYKLLPERNEEGSRASLLNQAFYTLNKKGKQFYMLGPNIQELEPSLEERIEYTFLHEPYNTVASNVQLVPAGGSKPERLVKLCKELRKETIVFCKSPRSASIVKYGPSGKYAVQCAFFSGYEGRCGVDKAGVSPRMAFC